jgi:site-specific DNA-methyltransferase (adenine-specific)
MTSPIIKEERIGNQRLILGDCLQILPTLAPVSHIITDPPYSARTHAGHNSAKASQKDKSDRAELGYPSLTPERVAALSAVFASLSKGWIVWFTDHVLMPAVSDCLEKQRRYVFAPLPFYQPGRSVRLVGDGPSSWTDWIVVARTNALSKWGTLPGGYAAGKGWNDKERRGGKPLQLMLAIVGDYSRFGETVLDPFMGAGTTCVACQKIGRSSVGIEIDPEAFATACSRVDEAARQPSLLSHNSPKQTPQGGLF